MGLDEVQRFLSSDKRLMLLLGDSGSGKSLFGQCCVCELLATQDEWTPLFIHLPLLDIEIKSNKVSFLERYLQNDCGLSTEQIEFIKQRKIKLFIFLDSYDEMEAQNQFINLYRVGRLYEWNIKDFVSCCTEALANKPLTVIR